MNPEVPKWLIKNKITNFEILPTVGISLFDHIRFNILLTFCCFLLFKDKAINAFNFLVAENRFVGAALVPTEHYIVHNASAKRHIDRARLYFDSEGQQEMLKDIKEGEERKVIEARRKSELELESENIKK